MKNPIYLVRNENGAIMMIMTMMVLSLLTIISFAGIRTSNTEVTIAGNEYAHQQNFYHAEGAAIEAVDNLDGETVVNAILHDWMMTYEGVTHFDDQIYDYWDTVVEGPSTIDGTPTAATLGSSTTSYMVVHHGVLSGDSLDLSKPTKHLFSVYGQSTNKGMVMIGIGYAKAF